MFSGGSIDETYSSPTNPTSLATGHVMQLRLWGIERTVCNANRNNKTTSDFSEKVVVEENASDKDVDCTQPVDPLEKERKKSPRAISITRQDKAG